MAGRLWAWVAERGDMTVALILAFVVGCLGLFDATSDQVVSSAILVTLAVLALAMLRDRSRQRSIERILTSANLDQVPGRLTAVNDVLDTSRKALDEASAIGVLVGKEISAALSAAREKTEIWFFRGGTGTFTRAVTLPECIDLARRGRRSLTVRLEILDPTDAAVCARYARFRRSLAPVSNPADEPWTAERTRLESYATILAACWYRQQYHLLDIGVALSGRVTTLRFDLSTSCLVITQEDPRNPALQVNSGRFFYDCYRAELGISFEQARRVPLDNAKDLSLDAEPTPNQIHELFGLLGVDLPSSYSESDLTRIREKALHALNPYT